MTRLQTLAAGLLAFLAVHDTPSAFAADPGITILAPAQNTVVRPGQTVKVRLDIDSSLQAATVNIGANMRYGMADIDLTTPPWEAEVEMLAEWSGPIDLLIVVQSSSGQYYDGPRLTLLVIPEETPSKLEAARSVYLDLPKTPGGPYPQPEVTRTLMVSGHYANNLERNITGPLFGTTYTSTNPSIVTVNAEGVLSPVAPGKTYVVIEHRGLKAFTRVTVEDPIIHDLPPVEETQSVSIQSGGFRLDRTRGVYVQQLTITNIGALPIVGSTLVLTGLPQGVSLANANGETKVITPLGSPWLNTDYSEPDYLSPGGSFTITLEFENRHGVPITYTPKLYTTTLP